jgi:hypothetical protein
MFSEKFINQLPGDVVSAVIVICKNFLSFHNAAENPFLNYKKYIESLGFFEAYAEKNSLDITFPDIDDKREKNIEKIINFFESTSKVYEKKYQQLSLERIKEGYTLKLGSPIQYEFTEGEILKVQKQIALLISLISSIKNIDEQYKKRLLKKLDQLQAFSYKTVYELDQFWGLIGEAGILRGKMGVYSGPLISKIKELAETIWQVQLKSEKLPLKTQLPIKW